MAQKSKAKSGSPKKSSSESTKVTRITATDTKTTTVAKANKPAAIKKTTETKAPRAATSDTPARKNILASIGSYFKGSWAELRQVRWPNRRTTWGLTLAVVIFTAFFVGMIVLLDYAFQLLFERILG